MTQRHRHLGKRAGLFIALIFLVGGCGDRIGGSGQCGGVDLNGVCVGVVSIQPTDDVTGFGDTSDVDAYRLITGDCNADGTANDPEPFGRHAILVTFTMSNISTVDDEEPALPDFVTITGYTIDYSLNPNSSSGPPLTTRDFTGPTILVELDETVIETLRFVEIDTKTEYRNNQPLGSTVFPSYTATYTFRGTDQFNNPLTLVAHAQFTIGDFDLCP